MADMPPNNPAAGNAEIVSRWAIGHPWPGLREPGRWAAEHAMNEKGVMYMPKSKQSTSEPVKLKDVLRAIILRTPPKKSKRTRPLQRMNYRDFRGI